MPQVKQNVQRTLAIELQRLSVQFRKQQKAYLNRLRKKDGPSSSSFSNVFDEATGTSGREALDPDYDPGFNEIQVADINAVRAPLYPDSLQGLLLVSRVLHPCVTFCLQDGQSIL